MHSSGNNWKFHKTTSIVSLQYKVIKICFYYNLFYKGKQFVSLVLQVVNIIFVVTEIVDVCLLWLIIYILLANYEYEFC